MLLLSSILFRKVFPELIQILRQGSNERDSSSAIERSSPVMLSAAKHLGAHRARPFAEFTLSGTNVLRVTLGDCSNCQELFFTIEPCLMIKKMQGLHAVRK